MSSTVTVSENNNTDMGHDKLTGLLTRESFFQNAEKLIKSRPAGYYILTCFDIENFKVINDQYGTEKGDEVLRHIADSIRNISDQIEGLACRFSGDRFAVLYPAAFVNTRGMERNHSDAMSPGCINRKIRIRIGRYKVNDLTLPVSAMYDRAVLAEESIRGRYDTSVAEFDDSMRTSLLNGQQIVNDMDRALAEGEFEPWLQPQYNHATATLIGAEALVRWKRDGRYVSPTEFIPIFESNGFIYEMDQYIWEQVCILLRRWIDEGRAPLPVSVNISRRDVFHDDFIKTLTGLVEKYELPYNMLRLEVTESAFAEASRQIIAKVGELIRLGFTVEIDDFGSGYSSLNTLKDVPASILKLDMKFFENTENRQRGGNIIESVVRMAKWLGMAVIAEGVEDKEQADYLKSIGCYYIQGYYYAKPMPVSDYEKLLAEAEKEPRLTRLETLTTLDNSEFWNPESMETLIFNSYVGGACIFEYYNEKSELLRINEQYTRELGGLVQPGAQLKDSSMVVFLDAENKSKLISAIHEAANNKREASCDVRLSNGKHDEYLHATVRLIARAEERLLFYCVIVNTTERREAERKQTEDAQQLEIIMSSINGGVSAIQIDDEGKSNFIFSNDKYYELYGYTQEQAAKASLDVMSLIAPEDFPSVMEKVKKLKSDRLPATIDYRCVKRDGSTAYLRANASLMHMDGYGDVITSVVTDITPEKEASDQLCFLNDSAHDILAQPDGDVAVNKTLEKLMAYFSGDRAYVIEIDYEKQVSYNTYERCAKGVTSEMNRLQGVPFSVSAYWFDMLGKDQFVVVPDVNGLGEDKAELRALLLEQNIRSLIVAPLWREGRLVGFVGIDNPSRATDQLERLRALGDYIAILLTRRDLSAKIDSDRIKMEELDAAKKRAEEQNQKSLLDNLPCGAALYEFDGKGLSVIHINKSYWELVGRAPVDYSKASVLDMIHPDDRSIVFQEMDAAIRQNRNIELNIRILCGKTAYKPFHVDAKISREENGRYLFFSTYTSISDESMSIQEMLPIALSTMMSASHDLSFVKDKDLHYICCSQSVVDMLGLESERDIIGKNDFELFERKLAEKFVANDSSVVKNGESLINFIEKVPGANGGIRLASTSKYPIMDASGNVVGIYGVSRDITAQRQKESQLELLTSSIPGGLAVYSIDENGIEMRYFNDGYYKFSGYSREEYSRLVTGDPLFFVFEDDKPAVRAMIDSFPEHKTEGHVNGCIYRCHTKNGGYRWMSLKTVLSQLSEEHFIVNAVQLDITEQQEEKERLRVSEEFNRIALDQSGNIITKFDVSSRTLTLPDSFNPIFVLPHVLHNMPEEQIVLGRISPDTADAYRTLFHDIISGKSAGKATYRQDSSKGWRWLEAQYTTIFSSLGKPVSAVISFTDITEKLEKEVVYNKWQQSLSNRPEESYTLFRCNLSKGASFDSWEGKLLHIDFDDAKQSFDERTREYVEQCVYKEDRKKYLSFVNSNTLLAEYYRGRRSDMLEYREADKNGDLRWLRLSVDLVEYPSSKDIEVYLMYENIDEQKKADLLTLERSEMDPLTGILNRATFIAKAEQILSESGIGEKHALLMLDVDNFKRVNDTLGHGTGDQVLRDLTAQIKAMLRHDDLIGRLGGDEFFVFLKNVPNDMAAAAKAKRICELEIWAQASNVMVTASIGIAMIPKDGRDFDTLYKKVDQALYRQKEHGKNGYLFV